jgi:hypothetical protein
MPDAESGSYLQIVHVQDAARTNNTRCQERGRSG